MKKALPIFLLLLIVNSIFAQQDCMPIMPLLSPIVLCDTDNNTQDGCSVFNLTVQTPIILAGQTLPTHATYYTNAAAASSTPAGTPIADPTSYLACNAANHTVWARIESDVTGCYDVGSFELQVNTPIVLTTPTLMSKCDDDANPNNMFTQFDIAGFVGTVQGHDIKFYEDAGHMYEISNPSQYVNTHQGNQTIFVVATNNTTGCKSYRTLTLEVLTIPTPNTPPALVACDDDNPGDMKEVFDLTANEAYVANGANNLSFHYYPSEAEAMAKQSEIIPATAALVGNNVWIRVENTNEDYRGNHCFVVVEQPVTVNPCLSIPDANFEQALINLGYDTVLDGKVDISAIDKITSLDLAGKNISDLTGIQNFISLQTLKCSNNQLTNLDISELSSLQNLDCTSNTELTCITVSDVEAANEKATWLKDEAASYSTSCSKMGVELPLSNAFSVKAFPNPFNNAFVVDVNALSHEPVNIKVYDMLGRLVDHMEVNANMITNQRIGQNYPVGIYNIIVTQEGQMKILRVVKN